MASNFSRGRTTVEIYVKGNPTERVQELLNFGIPYELYYSSSTARLVTEYEKRIYAESRITKKELILRNQIKKDINDRVSHVIRDERPAHYFRWAKKLGYMDLSEGEVIRVEDVYEVDLVSAYYHAAAKLGYLSPEFFERTKKLPKPIRLRLLGSIATRKQFETFDGEEFVSWVEQDDKMRAVWHNIVCYVDDVMQEMADYLGDRFLWYWVDGIYFTTFGSHDISATLVEQIAKKNSFEVTKKKLKRIEIRKVDKYMEGKVYDEKGCRIFTLSPTKIRNLNADIKL